MINQIGSPFVKSLFYFLVFVISGCIVAASNDEVLINPHQGNITDPSKEILVNKDKVV